MDMNLDMQHGHELGNAACTSPWLCCLPAKNLRHFINCFAMGTILKNTLILAVCNKSEKCSSIVKETVSRDFLTLVFSFNNF
jgi:hypothetical protein